jgi:hypothetical protein
MKKIFAPVSNWAFILNLLVLIVSVSLTFLHQKDLPPTLPLWFSKPWGEERLAEPNSLWLLPALIAVFLIVNNLAAKFLYRTHKVLALILVWAALIISLIVLFPLYRIVLVVI